MKQTLKHIKKNKKNFAISTFIDILFFVVFGFVYSHYMKKILPSLYELSQFSAAASQIAALTEQQVNVLVSRMDIFYQHYHIVINNLIYLAVTMFIIWVVLQSVSFRLVHNIVNKKKIGFRKYTTQFTVISVVYFIIYYFFTWILFKVSYLSSTSIMNVMTPKNFAWFFIVIFLVITYFLINTYLSIGEKGILTNSLKKAFNKDHLLKLISIFVALGVVFYLFVMVVKNFVGLAGQSIAIFLPLLILYFPLITLAKAYMLRK